MGSRADETAQCPWLGPAGTEYGGATLTVGRNRLDKLKHRAALNSSKALKNRSTALKRKWLVFLLLTLAACGIGLWIALK